MVLINPKTAALGLGWGGWGGEEGQFESPLFIFLKNVSLSRSENKKNFSVNINYFHRFFGFF